MSSEGIGYKNLLEIATEEQILQLCDPDMRMLVQAGSDRSNGLEAAQQRIMAQGAVDLRYACRAEEGQTVLFCLMKAYKPHSYARDLAAFARIPLESESSVESYYRARPRLLEDFLGWNLPQAQSDLAVESISGVVRPTYGLRYYQLMGVRKIIRKLDKHARCLYQAPTGAGKTRTAMAVVARQFVACGPTKVLWLASTTELVDQACHAFKREWTSKGDTDAVIYGWRGGGEQFNPENAADKNTMLVASLQLLAVRKPEVAALKGDVSLIVFDEAHQSLAPSYKDILEEHLNTGKCKLLGLSATPSRAESVEASAELAEMYLKKIVKIHTDGSNPIDYLVAQGYLAKTHFEMFSYRLNNFPQPNAMLPDYNDQFLDWLGKSVSRNLEIVKYVKYALDQGRKRILVFCPTILSAQYCATALRALHGVSSSNFISGETNRSVRARRLAKFTGSDPEPVVIFNCQVLTTGFDAPLTDAVVIARPTKSAPLYLQMVGRALRGPKSGGTDNAFVYNFADQELEGYNRLAELFESFNKAWN